MVCGTVPTLVLFTLNSSLMHVFDLKFCKNICMAVYTMWDELHCVLLLVPLAVCVYTVEETGDSKSTKSTREWRSSLVRGIVAGDHFNHVIYLSASYSR